MNTGTASQIKQAPRRLPNTLAKEVDNQVDRMLKNGLITLSMSPWSAPVILCERRTGQCAFV